jgi:hypothetical protein
LAKRLNRFTNKNLCAQSIACFYFQGKLKICPAGMPDGKNLLDAQDMANQIRSMTGSTLAGPNIQALINLLD